MRLWALFWSRYHSSSSAISSPWTPNTRQLSTVDRKFVSPFLRGCVRLPVMTFSSYTSIIGIAYTYRRAAPLELQRHLLYSEKTSWDVYRRFKNAQTHPQMLKTNWLNLMLDSIRLNFFIYLKLNIWYFKINLIICLSIRSVSSLKVIAFILILILLHELRVDLFYCCIWPKFHLLYLSLLQNALSITQPSIVSHFKQFFTKF